MAKKSGRDIINLKQSCNDFLRQGQFKYAQAELQKISILNIPKSQLAELAALARRAHLWKLSLKWLHPLVRPQSQSAPSASPREIVEYAMALQKAGAIIEANDLLSVVDPASEPRVLLSKAYLRMAQWDYLSAEAFLSAYIQSPSISDYERLTGKVNWLAALTVLKDSRVSDLAVDFENEARDGGHYLLLSNCLEISAQRFVSESNWSEARNSLQRAQLLIRQEQNLDSLFIDKWQAIVLALETRDAGKLSDFRSRALQLKHWETLRDLDFYQAVLEPDCSWADWVYFGTPFVGFRKRLETFRGFSEQTWISRSSKARETIDPWFPGKNEGDLSHRCFVLLLQDLYRPLRVAQAFGHLFPKEYYNPISSSNRIHQVMTRTRHWLKNMEPSFQLIEVDGAYSLRIPENLSLLYRKQSLSYEESHFFFNRYRSVLTSEFTTKDLLQFTDRSLSTLQRMIKIAVENNVLVKVGQGPLAAYQFCRL